MAPSLAGLSAVEQAQTYPHLDSVKSSASNHRSKTIRGLAVARDLVPNLGAYADLDAATSPLVRAIIDLPFKDAIIYPSRISQGAIDAAAAAETEIEAFQTAFKTVAIRAAADVCEAAIERILEIGRRGGWAEAGARELPEEDEMSAQWETAAAVPLALTGLWWTGMRWAAPALDRF